MYEQEGEGMKTEFGKLVDEFPDLLTSEHSIRSTRATSVYVADKPGQGNACHYYVVVDSEKGSILRHINFQDGPVKEVGVNGVTNEDLLAIIIHRISGFQEGEYACEENQDALDSLRSALMSLDERTSNREKRGVEGRNIK